MMNNKKLSLFVSILIICLTLLGIASTQDLVQKNKESIFLTKNSQVSYSYFKEEFSEKETLIVKKEFRFVANNDEEEFYNEVEKLALNFNDSCEVISKKNFSLKKQSSLFKFKGDEHLAFILICDGEKNKSKKVINFIQSHNYWKNNTKILGSSYTNLLLDNYSEKIKIYLFPLMFFGIFLALLFLTKNILICIYLFVPCLSSAAIALVTTKFIWGESNLIVAVVPLILFVISLSLSLHIFYSLEKEKSFIDIFKQKSKPIYLMLFTTFVGFVSLALSELEVIKNFGLLTGTLILVSFAVQFLWFLFSTTFFKKWIPLDGNSDFGRIINFFIKNLSYLMISILSLLSIAGSVLVFPQINTLTDATMYFPKDSGIKESIDNVASTVSGFPIMEILLQDKNEFKFKDYLNLSHKEIRLKQLIKKIDPSLELVSLNRLVTLANNEYSGVDSIPGEQMAYLALASKIPSIIKEGFPIFEENYRITILGKAINVDQYKKIMGIVKEVYGENKLEFNGLYYHLMIAQEKMITTLFKSFGFTLIIISSLALIAFKSLKIFFIFIIVNIIPVCINFILMYLFNLSFNIATVMTYSISLGLIVDSSFHIIHALDMRYSMTKYSKTIIKPVLTTNLILSFAFACFYFNDFLPIKEFGICLSMIILSGLFFDLKILPTLYIKNSNLAKYLK